MAYYYPVIDCALTSYAEDRHLTMKQVARALVLSKATYYTRRNGKSSWTIDELRIIATLTARGYEDLISERRRLL